MTRPVTDETNESVLQGDAERKRIPRGAKPPRANLKPCPRCRRRWIHRDLEVCSDCYREVGPASRPPGSGR